MKRNAILLSLSGLWHQPPTELRRRWARLVDIDTVRSALFKILRAEGSPITFDVFNEVITLGDDDIAIVIGQGEWDTFFVAQRERGGLSDISIHSGAERAVADFLGRALSEPGHSESLVTGLVRRRLQEEASH